MKILVFEYITGGGFNKQELPNSLIDEGRLMLQALLDNLHSHAKYNDLSIMVMLDYRVKGVINTYEFEEIFISPEQNSHDEFVHLVQRCDAAWPIAPEFDEILQTLCHAVELQGKKLLTSPTNAVVLTGNKFKTYERLKQHQILTVPTRLYNAAVWHKSKEAEKLLQELTEESKANLTHGVNQWMVKSIDGVGCNDSFLLTDQQDFERLSLRDGHYIIQPHIEGKKISLSCLFKQGVGWLICGNLQQFRIINQQYQLSGIIVNCVPNLSLYQGLVVSVAQAFPELWGYVGIDLIETPEKVFVLEINPRLTTSFAGIFDALGINVAENVLQLVKGKPTIKSMCSQTINIQVTHHEAD